MTLKRQGIYIVAKEEIKSALIEMYKYKRKTKLIRNIDIYE